jgi:hypothetical protein
MSTADGAVVSTTQIVDNGPASARWNLVIMGDGYQSAQLGQFANDAQSFVNTLFVTPPFDGLQGAINVFRVDVSSTDSGADDPTTCGGSGATARTYFDASFCNNGARRLLTVDAGTALSVAGAQVPQWRMAMVIVNSTVYGGSGGSVAVFSLAPGANEIGLHEMGHTAFGLADEYEYYLGCGVDTNRNNHPGVEPAADNVTIDANRATNKWRELIDPATPMPTTSNADCTQCDQQSNPYPPPTVGAFEGADYYHCGAYRPQFNCRMRALNNPFCAVCQRRMRHVFKPYMPGGSYTARVEPATTGVVPLPPPAGTGIVRFGRVFVSLASDFQGATVRLAIGKPGQWRIFQNLSVPPGRQVVYELVAGDEVASVAHQGGEPVDVLVEYQ